MKKKVLKVVRYIIKKTLQRGYKNVAHGARIGLNVKVFNKENLIMEDETSINSGSIIMNTRAKFIFKRGAGAATGLLVVTGNHMSIPGVKKRQLNDEVKNKFDINKECDQDVIVEEEVWIASRVTLLSGTIVKRGAIVGAGSVVRGSKIPPYAIVAGNPAKVVGFRFTPQEIIEHEKVIYPEKDRLPLDLLEKNYSKYFLKRIKEIKDFTRL